jgi:hypothetical protein
LRRFFGLPIAMQQPDVDRFRADLAAAVAAEVPVGFGPGTSTADLDRWCEVLRGVAGGQSCGSSADSIAGIDPSASGGTAVPRRLLAAFRVFATTDSMAEVLDGLTAVPEAERQVYRALRWPFLYLAIVMLVAILGLVFYAGRIQPVHDRLQAELTYPPAVREVPTLQWLDWLPTVVLVSASLFLVVLIGLLAGGFRWLVMAIGGRRFVQSRGNAAALRTTAALAAAGMGPAEAGQTARELVFGEPDRESAAAKASAGSVAVESGIGRHNRGDHPWLALAGYHQVVAEQQLRHLRVATPVVLLSVIGGAVGAGYALTIYGPLIRLLNQLVTAGS